jgi:transposase-like protein
VALVETNGKVRSMPVERVDFTTLRKALDQHCDKYAQIVTDEFSSYPFAAGLFGGGHETVNHSAGQYCRTIINEKGEAVKVHTNTAESYFALLKRGVYVTFRHVSKKHLHRYCNEFDFRWNGKELMDSERRDAAVRGAEGND